MTKNPDKWIRKGVIARIKAVNSTIGIYDTRLTGSVIPKSYIILSTQTKVDNQNNKCYGQWDCTILLDLVTRFSGTGNPGDRVTVNDLEDNVINALNTLDVDGFKVFRHWLESSDSLDNITDTENVFRQLVRYRFVLEES